MLDCNLSQKETALLLGKFEKNGMIKYGEVVRFLVLNPVSQEWEFKMNRVAHRRMRTIDVSAFDDEKSVNASTLNEIWDKHISTIKFGDHLSKASSKSKRSQFTTLSNADIVSNISRKSRKSRVKTAISRN